ncbi:MAG TPA: bacillithiol biosynthesis cysteine-adding enzyme BshC [Chryseolinea sp.]|nr:bacillithiol biosynthesis cysteine-adding enzyme BshC [Chryseolinea sp.]
MKLNKVAFADTRSFSPFFLDYIQQKETLKPYYNRFPLIQNVGDQIKEKSASFPTSSRSVLVKVLTHQYEGYPVSGAVQKNITDLQNEKTFTVTTGHQLNIFTGPLYFIYKIVTVINACKQLKAQYPNYNFVPVYWMASEDHDYDEIKYFKLYAKKYTWETDQKGAVGRFDTKSLAKLANEIPGETKIFREAYAKHKKLSDAVRAYVNTLFSNEGLVVIDGDDRSLKSLFTPVIQDDVINCSVKKLVDHTTSSLEDLGYKTQIYCRDINFFYLIDGLRSRIEKKENTYQVLDSDLRFTEAEVEKQIKEEPEKFSPNVILRPLYQEMILPNLAYVGGPAEVIYWLQLKDVFQHFNTPFPMLMPRNFGLVMDHEVARKFSKTDLELKDLFEEKNYLFNHWVLKHSPRNLTVGAEREGIVNLFEILRERAATVDKTLDPFVGAESKRALNSLEKIERKLLRAEKRLHSDKLRQIESVKDALFPNGSLQERTDNFLNFYQQDSEFIQKIMDAFDPFDFQMNVLQYEEQ